MQYLASKVIGIVTGSRADYGLLSPIIDVVRSNLSIGRYLFVTGEHLAVSTDIDVGLGIEVVKVETLVNSSTRMGTAKSIGLGVISFAEALAGKHLDVLIVLGDRFETFAAAIAAYTLGIPIAHIRGGELSGTLDDGYRHAITQLSTYHFTSNEKHSERVIRMGKPEENVFTVGDIISIPRIVKESSPHDSNCVLLVYHPVSDLEDYGLSELKHIIAVLEAGLEKCLNYVYVSGTNSDAGAPIIDRELRSFADRHQRVEFNQNLGYDDFIILLSCMNAIVGNSSVGITIAPSLGVGTINVGDRQKGRTQALSVINCSGELEDIRRAFDTLYSEAYQTILPYVENPYYGEEDVAVDIVRILLEQI